MAILTKSKILIADGEMLLGWRQKIMNWPAHFSIEFSGQRGADSMGIGVSRPKYEIFMSPEEAEKLILELQKGLDVIKPEPAEEK